MPEPPKRYVSKEKQNFLFEEEGFLVDFYRGLFIHDRRRVIISFRFASENSLEDLKDALRSSKRRFGKWAMLFLEKPSRSARKQLIKELEK